MVPADVAEALAEAGRRMDSHGWVPGSAGNLSARLDDKHIAITRSGVHKGRMVPHTDIIAVDFEGQPLVDDQKPSAETLLHCQLYRLFPPVGAVLHGHSIAATVLSLEGPITFSNYELLKAFGFTTHELDIPLPVYNNDQDIARLAQLIEPDLQAAPPIGYVIAGHGVYAWGTNVEHAYWRLEALEFLISCELERRQMK
ncbi:methylthioribulose 1-phosphate dehydratase [Acidocella aminolytica]|jgi:methylthioribulose-1-phosphate dehydratase|uniref:Methylthioribulose-1-phosphate dehydratase n=1 Tax=Acidocella aminolytica 101 = DSM 11237 TaxID=1120923 RepID=A0A0D6PC19_9PROT|nr:methylthioribulose 1-phosphate dehydratase [Acidocella aminolytica]GAN79305.1 methylthioribulose-1-phosphate dehydratase [Acidocella aminolytica 101 = DSM 11237]GBQ39581.1 methylthioribulose-1-phosphate dehydratase [Acidocella aminolytica 101 = DSM 11237]SHE37984.1 methylthioribulose-1-phosphate dehydratase [Acidocella aminolytica 101 = DSM 11237]